MTAVTPAEAEAWHAARAADTEAPPPPWVFCSCRSGQALPPSSPITMGLPAPISPNDPLESRKPRPPRRGFQDHAYLLVAEGSPVLPHQSKSGNAGDGSQTVGQEKTPPKRGQKVKGISGIGGRGASAAGQFRARGIVPTGKAPPKRGPRVYGSSRGRTVFRSSAAGQFGVRVPHQGVSPLLPTI